MAAWAPYAISAGVGLAGSLFGRKPSGDAWGQRVRQMGLTGIQNAQQQYQGLFDVGRRMAMGAQQPYEAQLRAVQTQLGQDPFTDTYRTARLNQATGDVNRMFDQSQSRIQADLAQRGLDTSSLASGALGANETGRAAALAQGLVPAALDATQMRDQRALQLLQILSGAYQQGLAQQMGALSPMASLYQGLLGAGQSADMAARQMQQQQNLQTAQLFGQLGTVAGYGLGGGVGTQRPKFGPGF